LYRRAAASGNADAKSYLDSFAAVGYTAGGQWVGEADSGGPVLLDLSGTWVGCCETPGIPWAFRVYQAGERFAAERVNVDSFAVMGQPAFTGW
jgi:hypothetical protein